MENQPVLETPAIYELPGCCEPFSAISHLLGAVVFLFLGLALLWRARNSRANVIYLAVYVVSLVLLLTMSGIYHMLVRGSAAHRVVERLDHGAILVLIAGSFTPIHGILLRGWQRWAPLALIWGAAILGATLKILFFDDFPHWASVALYLTMGWCGLFGGILLARRYSYNFIKPVVWGALAYTAGAMFDLLNWRVVIPGVIHPHELVHVAVLIGAFWHWLFMWQIARGTPGT
jgi:channel protein (hemolysin III family)